MLARHAWFQWLNTKHVHDARMRSFWKKFSDKQLDLQGVDAATPGLPPSPSASNGEKGIANTAREQPRVKSAAVHKSGQPLIVAIEALEEDPANPRSEIREADVDELADRASGSTASWKPSSFNQQMPRTGTASTLAPSGCEPPDAPDWLKSLSSSATRRPIPTRSSTRTRSAMA